MILIFGRTGQVAMELQRQVQGEARALGRAEVDLMTPGAARMAIETHCPTSVINAAAYTAVDRAEEEPEAAQRLNSGAPAEIAEACAAAGIPFCHVSTDYVFDGSGQTPWQETDTVAPLNTYGRSKLAGEQAVLAAGGSHVILRTSWVFSSHGANFVKTMLRLAETRERLSVVADQIGGPTPAADIAATLLSCAQGLKNGAAGGLYHYSGAPETSWAGFAREIFNQAGKTADVLDIPTTDYPTPATRPLNSRLNCAKLAADFGINQPSWQDGLTRVLKDLDV